MELKSQWEFSQASECRRGLMCGMGYSAEEQKRPRIAVVNSWNEYNPGHVHLKELAARVKAGIRDAGGLPLEVMTTAICDGRRPRAQPPRRQRRHGGPRLRHGRGRARRRLCRAARVKAGPHVLRAV